MQQKDNTVNEESFFNNTVYFFTISNEHFDTTHNVPSTDKEGCRRILAENLKKVTTPRKEEKEMTVHSFIKENGILLKQLLCPEAEQEPPLKKQCSVEVVTTTEKSWVFTEEEYKRAFYIMLGELNKK
jgi:hypothetical protein